MWRVNRQGKDVSKDFGRDTKAVRHNWYSINPSASKISDGNNMSRRLRYYFRMASSAFPWVNEGTFRRLRCRGMSRLMTKLSVHNETLFSLWQHRWHCRKHCR